jgi:SAM-dependent methyltransferase
VELSRQAAADVIVSLALALAAGLVALAALMLVMWPAARAGLRCYLVLPSDIRALVQGGRADAILSQTRKDNGDRQAFEAAYAGSDDPWVSINPQYSYQDRKYDGIMGFLPPARHFASTVDIGCGLGELSRRLMARSDAVLGMDLAQSAVDRARVKCCDVPNLSFAQGDVFDLPTHMNGKFDLVMLADILYYAPSGTDESYRRIAGRMADLLVPGGLCMLVNHYFIWDEPTQMSRRMHRAFRQDSKFKILGQRWRPFYFAMMLTASPALPEA